MITYDFRILFHISDHQSSKNTQNFLWRAVDAPFLSFYQESSPTEHSYNTLHSLTENSPIILTHHISIPSFSNHSKCSTSHPDLRFVRLNLNFWSTSGIAEFKLYFRKQGEDSKLLPFYNEISRSPVVIRLEFKNEPSNTKWYETQLSNWAVLMWIVPVWMNCR